MALPKRKEKPPKPAKAPKREKRWRSPAHTKWLTTEFACCNCGSTTNVVAAHYRLGSGTGMSRKPDDWRTTPLCDGPFANINGKLGCHNLQHRMGEPAFWEQYHRTHGQTAEQLIADLCRASPKSGEIAMAQRARALAYRMGNDG